MPNTFQKSNENIAVGKTQELVNAFLRGVYLWMTIGLAATALSSWIVMSSGAILYTLYTTPVLLYGLLFVELGLVFVLVSALPKLSATAATAMFVVYSVLTGVTLAPVVTLYTDASVAAAFFTCAGMFSAMSVYGLITKRDLTGMGNFLMMGLIGIIIAMIVNIFLQSSALGFAVNVIGVIIFTGLTAYDTQKLRVMGENAPMDDATAIRRGTIMGALTLYLDFINLFLMLLRLFGNRR
jgi:FtsH-binding integral membrane protein